MTAVRKAIAAAKKLRAAVDELEFSAPVTHVYNPLDYAWKAHEAYLRKLNPDGVRVLFVGMNPGPWGMAQTGVPFGEVAAVRDWLGIEMQVSPPEDENPKRPIEGFACQRSEVLWTPALGAIPRSVLHERSLLSGALRGELLSAGFHGSERQEPHA